MHMSQNRPKLVLILKDWKLCNNCEGVVKKKRAPLLPLKDLCMLRLEWLSRWWRDRRPLPWIALRQASVWSACNSWSSRMCVYGGFALAGSVTLVALQCMRKSQMWGIGKSKNMYCSQNCLSSAHWRHPMTCQIFFSGKMIFFSGQNTTTLVHLLLRYRSDNLSIHSTGRR